MISDLRFSTSIIIATADRPALVLDCVRSWRDQVPPAIELVIVDAGLAQPVDEAAVLALWSNSKVIRSAVRNAGIQRNRGVHEAKGDVIVFLDDDTIVQPGWWSAILDPLKDADVGVSAGAVWCNPAPRFTNKRGGYVNWIGVPVQITHRSCAAPRDVDWPMTTNMAVKRVAFEQVGGFCEAYGVYDEDIDLGLMIRRAGWRIVFQPNAAVYHYFLKMQRGPVTKGQVFRLGRNRSMLLVRNYGLFSRVWLFLLVMPWVKLWEVLWRVLRVAWTACGHAVAYMAGAVVGVGMGMKNRPK